MSKSEKDRDALQQALNYDWPEIQKHLAEQARQEREYQVDEDGREFYIDGSGRKVFVMNLDAWWLDRFDRNDVILELPGVVIMHTKPWHADDVAYTFREAYGVPPAEDCDDCFTRADIEAQIEVFPEGQFMAMRISGPSAGHAIALAATMRTSRPPTDFILPWTEAIGGLRLGNHETKGEWLYGVEMAVHPMYQGHGIGTALYEARFDLARRLNLRGWYAVGMLMGYHKVADEMDVIAYGNKVIAGEIKDPTVTMQLNRGFRAEQVVTDYCDEPAAGDAGVLIVWENPDYED